MARVTRTKIRRLGKKVLLWRHYYFDDFIFIHINKTGGTSIERALNIPARHKTVAELVELLGRSRWDNKYTFTVVRNPWDKVVSQYHYRAQSKDRAPRIGDVDFPTWVKLTFAERDPRFYDKPRMFMPQCDWLRDNDGHLAIDTVMRFENLASDFESVCKDLGRTLSLPHAKASRRGHYSDYYDADSRGIVEAWFEDDIIEFGYKF